MPAVRYGIKQQRYNPTAYSGASKKRRLSASPSGSYAQKRRRTARYRNMRTGGLLGIEKKFLDMAGSTVTISNQNDASNGVVSPSFGCTGCLSAPAQGDGPQNRDGKKIVIKSLFVEGNIDVNPNSVTALPSVPTVYVALVMDTQTNGVAATSQSVYSNPGALSLLAAQPFRNMSNTTRFKVLRTWKQRLDPAVMAMGDSVSGFDSGYNYPFTLSWKGDLPVNFVSTGTTANVSNVVDNSLHLIAYSSDNSAAPGLSFNARLRFIG